MLGSALRCIRVFHDLKQGEAAEKLCISRSYSERDRKRRKEATLQLVQRYAELFSIPASSILFFSENFDRPGAHQAARRLVAGKVLALMRFLEARSNGDAHALERSHTTLERSPFHGLQSRSKLAGLLFVSKKELKRLSGDEHLYTHFNVKKGEKPRPVDSPRRESKVVQRRIADSLCRVTPPDFLFCPVKRRSSINQCGTASWCPGCAFAGREEILPQHALTAGLLVLPSHVGVLHGRSGGAAEDRLLRRLPADRQPAESYHGLLRACRTSGRRWRSSHEPTDA